MHFFQKYIDCMVLPPCRIEVLLRMETFEYPTNKTTDQDR